MGFLERLLGKGASRQESEASTPEEDVRIVCETCGSEIDEFESDGELCVYCPEYEYSGPKYCCGQIYEEGEYVCMSCGETL